MPVSSTSWDANEYWTSREGCPFTFFAYLRDSADVEALPRDTRACELLEELSERGLRVGPWTNAPMERMAYLGCHKDDIEPVITAIRKLGLWDYCITKSQELLGIKEDGT